MFSDRDMRELVEFSSSHPVLSVYLNTTPSEGNADTYRLRLRSMLKPYDLPHDVSMIENYFQREYKWSGRGVAVFSCAPLHFFRAYPLAIPVNNFIIASDRPAIKPLTDLIDTYGGYGVVLVDKQGARVFYFHLGELQEQEGVLGEAIKHTKRGGASAMPGRRGGTAGQTHYEDEIIERNLKEEVEFVTRFFEEYHVRRLLIGGTDENVSQFRSLLPKSWQSLVMGTFAMSMTASHVEVAERAMQLGLEAEMIRETRLVENLITSAKKGANAVLGLEETLEAVNTRRVQTLFIHQGFRKQGYFCKDTQVLSARRSESALENAEKPAADIIELALNAVMQSGGDVEIVHANPVFLEAGSIGAMLRY